MTVSGTLDRAQLNTHFDDMKDELDSAIENGAEQVFYIPLQVWSLATGTAGAIRQLTFTAYTDYVVRSLTVKAKKNSGTGSDTCQALLEHVNSQGQAVTDFLPGDSLSVTLTPSGNTSLEDARTVWGDSTAVVPFLLAGRSYRLSLIAGDGGGGGTMDRALAVLGLGLKPRR